MKPISNDNSARYNILSAVILLRGASSRKISDYLDDKEVYYGYDVIRMTLSHALGEDFLRKDSSACGECGKTHNRYVATEKLKLSIGV